MSMATRRLKMECLKISRPWFSRGLYYLLTPPQRYVVRRTSRLFPTNSDCRLSVYAILMFMALGNSLNLSRESWPFLSLTLLPEAHCIFLVMGIRQGILYMLMM